MTPDYAALLADRSPDGPRAALLDSLSLGLPVSRALSGAFEGRIPVGAWRALGEMRRSDGAAYDVEVAEACERAEREEERRARDGKPDAGEVGSGTDGRDEGHEAPQDAGEVSQLTSPAAKPSAMARPMLIHHRHIDGREALSGCGIVPSALLRFRCRLPPTPARQETPERVTRSGHGTAPVRHVAPTGWGALIATEPRPDPDESAFVRVGREADALARARGYHDAPPLFHTLLWIDDMCVKAGMHALDVWWLRTLLLFLISGKLVLVVRVGLRGAKSVSICRALVNDALFGHCDADKATVGVIPIMSADRTEATDRFHTIKAVLAACGVGEKKRKGEEDELAPPLAPGGLGMSYKASTLPSGGGVITIEDIDGREVQFRIYPARLSGVIGHTDKAGFGDELDTWPVDLGVSAADVAQRSVGGKANPADVVLDRWLERFTTTRKTAHLYLVSASYFGHDTAHARKVAEGDTAIQMVARLGRDGSAKDYEMRRRLAGAFKLDDARLIAPADPLSTDVPAWVTSPAAPIEDCFALSRSRLGPMFGRYGGRPDEAEGGRGPLADIEIPTNERVTTCADIAIGVAPPDAESPEWGIVVVGLVNGVCGLLALADASGIFDGREAASRVRTLCLCYPLASVLAVASEHAPRVTAEILAAFAGAGIPLAPVAPQAISDASGLYVGTLRTHYQRGTLRHAGELGELGAAVTGWTRDRRSPRVEALVAAVARLMACYPWLDVQSNEEPMRGPRATETALDGSGLRGMDLVRRLGGR